MENNRVFRITRMDKGPDGMDIEVLIGFTNDQAEVGCLIDEDRHKIDWDAEYCVEVERE